MKNLRLLITISIVLVSVFSMLTSPAHSGTYTFSPSPSDLSDLDHNYYYTWGINWSLPGGETITGATLTYNNIWDWTVETDHLYTHLLNSAPSGVNWQWDGEGGGDNFANANQNLLLGDLGGWNDPYGGYPRNFNLVYEIPDTHFSWLSSDENFGFGIDPDCHYYNDGITFTITTTHEAPEPATLLLLGSGLIGLAGLARRKFSKK